MLPAAKSHRFSLADVLPNCLEALAGRRGPLGLAPVTHAVVVLVDGLGDALLRARAGHLRAVAARLGVDRPISAPFPTTTAAALASLTTGTDPGRHGLVGYEILDPADDVVRNQLTGWGEGSMRPDSWQRMPTLFERAVASGVDAVAIGSPRFRDSGFTAGVLRGARYLGGRTIADRVAAAREVLASTERALVYLYVPELDSASHHAGGDSLEWVAVAEELDAALGPFLSSLRPTHGALVTADHGAVDVARDAHVIVDRALLAGVRHVAGEPRCLQLHVEAEADATAVAEAWRAREGARAWVATRAEAIAAGWFGPVDDEVAPRIGDVLVAARRPVAYYVDEAAPGRGMVGQHGSLTPDESAVPLARFGAFAR